MMSEQTMSSPGAAPATAAEHRKVTLLLGLGILFLPYVFAWLTLRKGYSTTARAVAFGWLAVMVLALARDRSTSPPSNSPTSRPAAVSQQFGSQSAPAAAKPAVKEVDPVAERAAIATEMAAIEKRVQENRDKLKKFYATPDLAKQAQADWLRLLTVVARASLSEVKEDKQQGAQAKVLAGKAAEVARDMYASAVEHTFVQNGMDMKVKAGGKAKEQLTVTYALMNKPLVYKFQNEMGIDTQAKSFGFTKIVMSNGFEGSMNEYWTLDLK